MADSLHRGELRPDTHEVLRHLETCAACREELATRRRLRGALRGAFNRAPDLQPTAEFTNLLRRRLREAAVPRQRALAYHWRWLALAAGLVVVAALDAGVFHSSSNTATDALTRDSIGDHRDCALKYRRIRTPVPLDEAARRFDSAYRLLVSAPPDDISTPDGTAHVTERHSCTYGERRFGHVILQYRGRVVSLLVTSDAGAAGPAQSAGHVPHLIGQPVDGLSAVSVNGSRHAIVLVSDLGASELAGLAEIISLPMLPQLDAAIPDPKSGAPLLAMRTQQPLNSYLSVRPPD